MKWYVSTALGLLLTAGLACADEAAVKAETTAAAEAVKTEAAATVEAVKADAAPAAAKAEEAKAAEKGASASDALKTDEQKFSYAMGLSLGKYFKELEEQFDLDMVHRGVQDGFGSAEPLLSEEEAQKIQQDFAKRQHDKQLQKAVATIRKNNKAAEEFLSANKAKPGVVTTESGLQYKVVKQGSGAKPTPEDTVRVHYKGRTIDGQEFDSSYKRNEPAEFQVKQVIPGWQEAMTIMPVGSTYEIYLPPDLAYGDQGAPPVIEPGSLIIFEVELLDVLKGDGKEEEKKK